MCRVERLGDGFSRSARATGLFGAAVMKQYDRAVTLVRAEENQLQDE
jgi:hypothetical protein